jgi:hypothetical protein
MTVTVKKSGGSVKEDWVKKSGGSVKEDWRAGSRDPLPHDSRFGVARNQRLTTIAI